MGWYREHVVPRLVDLTCGQAGLDPWRARACADLHGVVVEVGFGSGRNIVHYPDDLRVVYAVEPAALSTRLAGPRQAASRIPIEHVGLDGGAIPLPDSSCDSALSTFTLCTVPDPTVVLAEIARVLVPGGTLHFVEHGLAPDASVARWQHRLDPLEVRVADGCHLTRAPLDLLEAAGYAPVWSDERYVKGPKPWSYLTVGVAARPM